jgi:hypothetical protein
MDRRVKSYEEEPPASLNIYPSASATWRFYSSAEDPSTVHSSRSVRHRRATPAASVSPHPARQQGGGGGGVLESASELGWVTTDDDDDYDDMESEELTEEEDHHDTNA